MGRIKTAKIKASSEEIYNKHKTKFKLDFEDNKQNLIKFAEIPSKKNRNVIAGYITKLVKQGK